MPKGFFSGLAFQDSFVGLLMTDMPTKFETGFWGWILEKKNWWDQFVFDGPLENVCVFIFSFIWGAGSTHWANSVLLSETSFNCMAHKKKSQWIVTLSVWNLRPVRFSLSSFHKNAHCVRPWPPRHNPTRLLTLFPPSVHLYVISTPCPIYRWQRRSLFSAPKLSSRMSPICPPLPSPQF